MKKMIMAAAIVCAATFANAASMNWGITTVLDSPDAPASAGWVAYFMDGSTYEAFSALDAGKIASFVSGGKTYEAVAAAGRGGVITASATSGDYAAGASVSGYMVIFNSGDASKATYFANTALETKQVPGSGNLQFTADFGTRTAGWKSLASTPTPPGPTPDVPEPTSGLLLVLGGAALALRRRR